MSSTLPRKLSSAGDLRAALPSLSDLQDAIRALPEVQLKTVTLVAGDYPLFPSTTVKTPIGVSIVGVWLDADPSVAVYATGIHWEPGPDQDVKIHGINGLTSGTKYRITLRIEGSR